MDRLYKQLNIILKATINTHTHCHNISTDIIYTWWEMDFVSINVQQYIYFAFAEY